MPGFARAEKECPMSLFITWPEYCKLRRYEMQLNGLEVLDLDRERDHWEERDRTPAFPPGYEPAIACLTNVRPHECSGIRYLTLPVFPVRFLWKGNGAPRYFQPKDRFAPYLVDAAIIHRLDDGLALGRDYSPASYLEVANAFGQLREIAGGSVATLLPQYEGQVLPSGERTYGSRVQAYHWNGKVTLDTGNCGGLPHEHHTLWVRWRHGRKLGVDDMSLVEWTPPESVSVPASPPGDEVDESIMELDLEDDPGVAEPPTAPPPSSSDDEFSSEFELTLDDSGDAPQSLDSGPRTPLPRKSDEDGAAKELPIEQD